MAELHLHGSYSVIKGVYEAFEFLKTQGVDVKPADPGEFTKRAFLNDKLDLMEIEGLSDLLDSQTTAQRSQALAQMGGKSSQRLIEWRDKLIKMLAHTEAMIDFGDDDREGDIQENLIFPELVEDVIKIKGEVDKFLEMGEVGEMVRGGLEMVIVGAPNVGKSSLLNGLMEREMAIVSSIPG